MSDGWLFGNREVLHHIQSRSQLEDDVSGNLITLCSECHRVVYGRRLVNTPVSKSQES
ncbi:MAG: HNH endonuclease [Candidatus Acidiferrales bacterium]